MSLGDDEHPISFRFVPVIGPGHVQVTVWAGHRDAGRGNAGTITLRHNEWAALRALLGRCIPVEEPLAAMLRYTPVGVPGRSVQHIYIDETPIDIDDASTYEPVLDRLDATLELIAALPLNASGQEK